MTKSERLEPIAQLAGVRESVAARALAQSLTDLKVKEAELAQLRAYLEEYRQLAMSGDGAVDPQRWQNAQKFVARLGEAVRAQEHELESAADRYRAEAERWRVSHCNTQALERLVEKYYRQELLEVEQREQAEIDELVIRLTR
jgi:flagellar export protein FliJ